MTRDHERHPAPQSYPAHEPARAARYGGDVPHRSGSYWTALAGGVLAPFALAALLSSILWWPVAAVLVPLLAGLWAALATVLAALGAYDPDPAPPPDSQIAGQMPWEAALSLTPEAALCWAVALPVSVLVCRRAAGLGSSARHATIAREDRSAARRGFAAGLRVALVLALVLGLLWLNTVLGGPR